MIPPELMAAVCGDRSDDVPRLVVADWLDDRGECERAEFIRVQCEIAKWNARPMPKDCAMTADKFSQLLFREAVLAEPLNLVRWGFGIPAPLLPSQRERWTRGFVSTVRCRWSDWVEQADGILAATPLEWVEFTEPIPVDMTRVAAVGADYVMYRLGRFAKSGTWRVTIPRDYSSGPSVDLGDLYYDRAVDALLKNHWPGIRFEFPRSANFAAVSAQRGPIEFAPHLQGGWGSGTVGG